MKTKRILFLAMSMIMLLSTLTGVALAAPSPTASTISVLGGSANVLIEQLLATSPEFEKLEAELSKAADDYAAEILANDPAFKDGFELAKLVTAELKVDLGGKTSAKVSLNVAGVKAGDRIFIVMRLANGRTVVVEATVIADGEIEFDVPGNCTIQVVRADKKGTAASGIVKLPKTSSR